MLIDVAKSNHMVTYFVLARHLLWVLVVGLAAEHAIAQCEEVKLVVNDAVGGDRYGSAVAVGEAHVAVASPGAQGQGEVRVFPVGSPWSSNDSLMAPDGSPGDSFGSAIDLYGTGLVVGAPLDDDSGVDQGSAYVYRFDGITWNFEAKILAPDGAAYDAFGHAVHLHDDTLLVGSPQDDVFGESSGAVYVFRHVGSSWVFEEKLIAFDGQAGDIFGSSVAFDGATLVVGAGWSNENGVAAGSAYIYALAGPGFILDAKLVANDSSIGAWFGSSVAVDSDRIVIGAMWESSNATFGGAAYVFRRDAGLWIQEAKLNPPRSDVGALFGSSVAIVGERIAVGSPYALNSGSAWLWRRVSGTWSDTQELIASDASNGDRAGRTIDMVGDRLAVGADMVDGASSDTGASYLWAVTELAASWSLYGSGWPGTNGVPTLSPSANPVIGESFELEIGNSSGVAAYSVLLIGIASTDVPTRLDGHLLVIPFTLLQLPLPPITSHIPVTVPCDSIFGGISVFLQGLQADSGATQGVSFTQGLELVLGM